uniref:Uncharacterized protein n=1 Tax=Hucho hucho TaxID=62062 RepID=A0A4W5P4L1_9TELE
MSTADGEACTEEFHSHSLNLLGNLPLPCLDVLLLPKVQQGSIEFMGVNMDTVNMLLEYMEKGLGRVSCLGSSTTGPLKHAVTDAQWSFPYSILF